MKNLPVKLQQGNFTVEFAIVGVFFAMLLVFSADIVVKLAYKGKLERLSYSAVTIIKERTEVYGTDHFDFDPNQQIGSEATQLYEITLSSLKRTTSNFNSEKFGFQIRMVRDNKNVRAPFKQGIDCNNTQSLQDLDFITTFGRHATLYEVTLCYDTPSWYGHLIGQQFSRVSSRSVSMGR
ncbi:ATP-binding protein [Vibrio sp. HDW18]|uniref:tight adherence pilus pseudopilin TadF n=1 Tax=Vibrio TaxID=662 RepID=UPI00140B65D9|nr:MULTISPECIES: tight adherence pilus pseudopilin TadF [unclassified Vibrio]QIL85346.1 ATP-binding protein [Vibrio sp. HDW18]